ncbi:MAG: hypothetical protein ACRDQ5_04840 [Sciscionella sp.]
MQTAYTPHDGGSTDEPTRHTADEYDINLQGRSDHGTDVRREVTGDIDRQDQQGGILTRLFNSVTRDQRIQDEYTRRMEQQAKQLAGDLGVREPPKLPASHYDGVDHPTLQSMVRDGVDTAAVGEQGEKSIDFGNQMVAFQEDIARSIYSSEADWRGTAGNNARQYMADLANWVGKAGKAVEYSGTQVCLHSQNLNEAARAMPEPVKFDVDQANQRLQQMSGDPVAMMQQYEQDKQTYQRQQDAKAEAARVVQGWDSSQRANAAMPEFGKPPMFSGNGDGRDDRDGRDDNGGGNHPFRGGGRDGGTGSSGGGAGGGGSPHVPAIPGGDGGPRGGTPGGGLPGGQPRIPHPGPTVGTDPQFAGGGNVPGGGNIPSAGNTPGGGSGVSAGTNFGGMPAPMPIGGGLGGGFGVATPRGGGGFGGAGGFGPRGSGGAVGAGGSTGSGPGAAAAQEAAVRGGAAGAGGRGGGAAGAPIGGGRGGRGEGDGEHKANAYLVESDADEIFGTDQLTAPPVIGE